MTSVKQEVRSDLSGLYKKSVEERREVVEAVCGVQVDCSTTRHVALADGLVENVIATTTMPLSVVTYLRVNGGDVLVPMVTEESSVVAAASRGAKLARALGGFEACTDGNLACSQVLLVAPSGEGSEAAAVAAAVAGQERQWRGLLNATRPSLVKRGGGVQSVEARAVSTRRGAMVVVTLTVDVCDCMGANTVTQLAEVLAPELEACTGWEARMSIVSNDGAKRLAHATAVWRAEDLGGSDVVDAILDADAFAEADPARALTANKGVMNGVAAVAQALMADTRALGAAVHGWASRGGTYAPLTRYERTPDGDLRGHITLPVPVGVVGGATSVHPEAQTALAILGITTARELGEVLASVGLAQNLAALLALVTEGLCKGHMRLHAQNLAIMAGADEAGSAKAVAAQMVREGCVTVSRAAQLLAETAATVAVNACPLQ